jgi:putative ABC transport system permease protein
VLDQLLHDIVYARRSLLRRPFFAITAAGLVALGAGSLGALLCVVKPVLVEGLPFRDVDRLVMVFQQDLPANRDRITVAGGEYTEYQAGSKLLESLAAVRPAPALTTVLHGETLATDAARMSTNLLDTLGVRPVLGRAFGAADVAQGDASVALISYKMWQRDFGGDAGVLGRTLPIQEATLTAISGTGTANARRAAPVIVGVLPSDFHILYTDADVWLPLDPAPERANYQQRGLRLIGRMRPDVTVAALSDELNTIDRGISATVTRTFGGQTVFVVSLRQEEIGDIRPSLLAMLVAAGLVLLTVCANVANMLLVRTLEREREVAVRLALGASHRRLIRQFLTEGLLLSGAGGLVGLALAAAGARTIAAWGPASIPRLDRVQLDWSVSLFTLATVLFTGLITSLPMISRGLLARTQQALTTRGGRTLGSQRLMRGLVVAEIALALVTLIGAGVSAESFYRLSGVELGFDPSHVLTFRVSLASERYRTPDSRVRFFHELRERLRGNPDVLAAGAVSIPPMTDNDQIMLYEIPGAETRPGQRPPSARFRAVTPGYFASLRVPVIAGREFQDDDVARRSVVVSDAFARRTWPGRSAIGQTITLNFPGGAQRGLAIVGVVGDVRQFRDTAPEPMIYYASSANTAMTVVVRTLSDPTASVAAMRALVHDLDASVPLSNVATMQTRADTVGQFPQVRFRAIVAIGCGMLTLALASLGLFAVMSYIVVQRTREIGIRMALGARPGDVVRMVLRRGLLDAAVGIGLGIICSLWLMTVLARFLYGIRPFEPQALLGVSAVVLLVAAFAACVPALRASFVDPLIATKSE